MAQCCANCREPYLDIVSIDKPDDKYGELEIGGLCEELCSPNVSVVNKTMFELISTL